MDDGNITNLVTAMQNLVRAVNTINQTISIVFPQTIGISSSASAGVAALPINPVGFLDIVNPVTGGTVKVPYYS